MNDLGISPEGAQNLMRQIDDLWIGPEIGRRFPTGVPSGFKVVQCMILLPHDRPASVSFNDEIQIVATPKLAPALR